MAEDDEERDCGSQETFKRSDDFSEVPVWKRSSLWRTHVNQYKTSVYQKFLHYKGQHLNSGEEMFLAELYTEPNIIQKKNSCFHVRSVHLDDLFKSNQLFYEAKTVFLQGSSGSGKSLIAQKIMWDWASGKPLPAFHKHDLFFYLSCEELMCISEEKNLFELLSWSFNLPSDQISEMIQQPSVNILFIIDGFDELKLTCRNHCMSHLSERAPPEVIVYALLRKQILSRSCLLVTTRTEVPQGTLLKRATDCTTIMGFSEKKIEEYFQKFFQDEELFRNAYGCVKANETLFTACSIPVICWIICTVIRERFSDGADVTSALETTTSIYVDFVFSLLERHCQDLNESVPALLKSLSQLAERGMLEQQVLFDERTINETVQALVRSPFLEKRIHQETMISFRHLSFQEFFSALHCVLLDKDKSQEKVRELLKTVERGWILSCWSVADFSIADSEIRHSKQLQSVILFLCGLCGNKLIDRLFVKHNVAVSVNTEAQLKEWIHQSSPRYQHENMLFILHCLYELHQKSFTEEVLEGLILIDLSNVLLKRTDCWVLRFCLQCCAHIRNLRISVTPDHLKILQPALHRCEELWLMMDHISDDVGDLISALSETKTLIIKVDKKKSSTYSGILVSAKDGDVTLSISCSKSKRKSPRLLSEVTFTCSCSEMSTISWKNILQRLQTLPSFGGSGKLVLAERETLVEVLQSVSGLKEVRLQVDRWTDRWISTIVSLTQICPSLTQLRINGTFSFVPAAVKLSLEESLTHTDWSLTARRQSLRMKRDRKTLTEEELKTGTRENKDSVDSRVSSEDVLFSTAKSAVEDAVIFTPEDDKTKATNTRRFLSPHAGQFQCSLTDLVFVMEGEGEMLYKMVSWDPRLLDGLGQMQPAGPLYNIDCTEGSISQLHLPHCESFTEDNKVSLAVAHFIGDNVEILQPLDVTDTHVIIKSTEFSLFGLIKKIMFPPSPVRSQVLLFLQPNKETVQTLYVHLLPANVPMSEVQKQHKATNIKTTSSCLLFPENEYSLRCQPETFKVQPQGEKFECNFGPNFHPTFEVFVDVDTRELKMEVLDIAEKKKVWTRLIFLIASPNADTAEIRKVTEFVDSHRNVLIARVCSVMATADTLRSRKMIPPERYSDIYEAKTRQSKMRLLFEVLDSGGSAVKAEFYRTLKDQEPFLVQELEEAVQTI